MGEWESKQVSGISSWKSLVSSANTTAIDIGNQNLHQDMCPPKRMFFVEIETIKERNQADNTSRKMENFIRTKYESKRWVMDGPMPDPSTLDTEADDDVVSPCRQRFRRYS